MSSRLSSPLILAYSQPGDEVKIVVMCGHIKIDMEWENGNIDSLV